MRARTHSHSTHPRAPRWRTAQPGRQELGQNFLTHRPTIRRISRLVTQTQGAILEIGAGDGAITLALDRLNRELRAIDIDPRRVRALRRQVRRATVHHADALSEPLDVPVVVGNIPFHLTTPILRRLLSTGTWRHAVLLTQWEVARKRAGVGGGTMLTAQALPWFDFRLEGRVPASAFSPRPAVDGGILVIQRREEPHVPLVERRRYERFVADIFTGPGASLRPALRHASGRTRSEVDLALRRLGIPASTPPGRLTVEHWAGLWRALRPNAEGPRLRRPTSSGGTPSRG
jgi:23S rRNA (adenine-N6)-dimethyltransferase